MVTKLKPLHISRLRDVLEREDAAGKIPFSITYACQNGGLVDIQEKCMVCIAVDTHLHTHTIKSVISKEIRRVRDCLILRVNDSKIVMS